MEAKTALRAKNQVTLPEKIVRKLGIQPGDRLIVWVEEDEPELIRVRPLRRSYAGIAAGLYGRKPEEVHDYIEGERSSWDSDKVND